MHNQQFYELIRFIDCMTNRGLTSHEKEPWGEGIGLEKKGVEYINSLTTENWLSLKKLIGEKTDLWIKCLIDLLYEYDDIEAHRILVYIALNGTQANFLDAMECIHEFKQEVTEEILQKLKNRSDLIIRKKLDSKFIDQNC